MPDPRAYWEERLAARFGLDGVGYAGLGRPYNEWLYRVRERVFLQAVREIGVDVRRSDVLDIGSGTGFYVHLWRSLRARNLIGSDITEVSVRRLAEAFPEVTFVRMDIGDANLPLDPGRFDIVSALDVLFHIVDDCRFLRALENVASLLRPGGLFLYSDNFVHGAALRSSHQVSRPLSDVVSALHTAGLTPIRRRPVFVLMNAPVDSPSSIHHAAWGLLERILRRSGRLGAIAGATLFPLELLLLHLVREGPSTELMVCRKNPVDRGAVSPISSP